MCRHTFEVFDCCDSHGYTPERCEAFRFKRQQGKVSRRHLKQKARQQVQRSTTTTTSSSSSSTSISSSSSSSNGSSSRTSSSSSSQDSSTIHKVNKHCSIKLHVCHPTYHIFHTRTCYACWRNFLMSETEYRDSGEVEWRKVDYQRPVAEDLDREKRGGYYGSLAPDEKGEDVKLDLDVEGELGI